MLGFWDSVMLRDADSRNLQGWERAPATAPWDRECSGSRRDTGPLACPEGPNAQYLRFVITEAMNY